MPLALSSWIVVVKSTEFTTFGVFDQGCCTSVFAKLGLKSKWTSCGTGILVRLVIAGNVKCVNDRYWFHLEEVLLLCVLVPCNCDWDTYDLIRRYCQLRFFLLRPIKFCFSNCYDSSTYRLEQKKVWSMQTKAKFSAGRSCIDWEHFSRMHVSNSWLNPEQSSAVTHTVSHFGTATNNSSKPNLK